MAGMHVVVSHEHSRNTGATPSCKHIRVLNINQAYLCKLRGLAVWRRMLGTGRGPSWPLRQKATPPPGAPQSARWPSSRCCVQVLRNQTCLEACERYGACIVWGSGGGATLTVDTASAKC